MKAFNVFTDHGEIYTVRAANESAARIKALPMLKYYEIIESVFESDDEDEEN